MRIKYLFLIVLLMGCDNRETIVYNPNLKLEYSILERANYREAPDFDFLKTESNSLNGKFNRANKKIDSSNFTSFITLNSIENQKAIVYFSNDAIKINKYLQIITLDKDEDLKIEFENKLVLPTHHLLHINIYYIPVEKLEKNSVTIEGHYFKENFNFIGVKDKDFDEIMIISEYHRKRMIKSGGIDLDSLELR